MIATEDYASGGPPAGLSLEHLEVSLEEVVEDGALAAVLTADDGDCEIVLLRLLEAPEDRVESLDPK